MHVPSKQLQEVYLLPNTNFRAYHKVQIAPTEVALQKNWLRDFNDQAMDLSGRLSDADARKITDMARQGFQDILAKAYAAAGYQVVTEDGYDVLQIRTALINLTITTPDTKSPVRSRTFSADAGQATLVVEARDTMTGAILGRAVDRRIAGDNGPWERNSVTNRADFERLFETWAKKSVTGLETLKASSPVGADGQPGKP